MKILVFYSLYPPKAVKKASLMLLPSKGGIIGNAFVTRVGTDGLEPSTSAM